MVRLPVLVTTLALVMVLVMACGGGTLTPTLPPASPSPTDTATPTPTPTVTGTPSPTPTSTTPAPSPVVSPAPTQTPSPTTTPTPTSEAEVTPVPFFLEVVAPQDESVVNSAVIDVTGRTVPDAVVTVNGQVVEVDANGSFAAMVTLEEGPNSIEVIASDFQSNQGSEVLTVIYVA